MLDSFEKGHDLELRVSVVRLGDHSWIEVSDYVPSRESYRRGVVLPMSMKQRVSAAIRKARVDA